MRSPRDVAVVMAASASIVVGSAAVAHAAHAVPAADDFPTPVTATPTSGAVPGSTGGPDYPKASGNPRDPFGSGGGGTTSPPTSQPLTQTPTSRSTANSGSTSTATPTTGSGTSTASPKPDATAKTGKETVVFGVAGTGLILLGSGLVFRSRRGAHEV